MLLDLTVSKTILIHSPLENVWKALTDPAIIKEYLYGTETLTNWKVGSEIVFQGEYQGHKYRDHGVILENIPNQKIVYSYWSGFSGLEDKPENRNTITYQLVPINATTTELSWIQKGYASEEAYDHSSSGMDAFMEQLKNVIEKHN